MGRRVWSLVVAWVAWGASCGRLRWSLAVRPSGAESGTVPNVKVLQTKQGWGADGRIALRRFSRLGRGCRPNQPRGSLRSFGSLTELEGTPELEPNGLYLAGTRGSDKTFDGTFFKPRPQFRRPGVPLHWWKSLPWFQVDGTWKMEAAAQSKARGCRCTGCAD